MTKKILMDFWAAWCNPCESMTPMAELLVQKHGLILKKVNVEEEPETAKKFGVQSLPTFIIIIGGKTKAISVGKKKQYEFDRWLQNNLTE